MITLGPTSPWEALLAVFLVMVFASSAWHKRGTAWPDQVVGYRLWPGPAARALARLVKLAEAGTAALLIVACQAGFMLAGTLFLSYGLVLVIALRSGYRGPCGCSSASASVSRPKVWRAILWAGIALAAGVSYFTADFGSAIVMFGAVTASTVAIVTMSITTSIRRFGALAS
jgi:Methylamine utilisation protein MauE